MGYEYVVNCDTLGFLGHDVLENPLEVLGAIKAAGYAGVDLPGNPELVDATALRAIVDDLGLVVPEVSGAWAWAGAEGIARPMVSAIAVNRARFGMFVSCGGGGASGASMGPGVYCPALEAPNVRTRSDP